MVQFGEKIKKNFWPKIDLGHPGDLGELNLDFGLVGLPRLPEKGQPGGKSATAMPFHPSS